MNTQQTSSSTSQQSIQATSEEANIWRQVMGDKAYTRAIRREHSARYQHPCPWCSFETTTPYNKPEVHTSGSQRLCENCQFIFTARQEPRADSSDHCRLTTNSIHTRFSSYRFSPPRLSTVVTGTGIHCDLPPKAGSANASNHMTRSL